MSLELRYFAWVRERIGSPGENIDVPSEVTTVGDLISWLSSKDEGYAAAFAEPDIIRAAIDHEHADHDTALAGAKEVAFFPPMTGG